MNTVSIITFFIGVACPLFVLSVRKEMRSRGDRWRCGWCNSKLAKGMTSPCRDCLQEAARDAAGPKDWPRS